MKQYQRNMLVEQFNAEYPNQGKLEIYLPTPGSPTKELKSVKAFTDDEKVAYMQDILYLRMYSGIQRIAKKNQVPLLDPWDEDLEVPKSITRAYLATLR